MRNGAVQPEIVIAAPVRARLARREAEVREVAHPLQLGRSVRHGDAVVGVPACGPHAARDVVACQADGSQAHAR